jgi:sulfite reductase alpha subunit-like flavoprotein
LNDSISYGPGAIAVVYPKNFPADVQDFINLMDWEDIADTPLALMPNTSNSPQRSQSLSPLRHLDLSGINLTIRYLLSNTLDIMSIPRRTFFASLSHFANGDTEDERYQKERLLELANPDLIDELWDYTTRPKRTILEVMMDFTSLKIPWQYALSVLPLMKGRQFSIASGGLLTRDEQGRTRVQLLVAIADPPSPIIKFRRRYGVCTRYIASLEAGQEINIGVQPGYLDVQPREMDVPVVMIGPGTGLAPMRAMIWQRLLWGQDAQERSAAGKKLAGDILLFGCRSEYGDYFFREEWERLQLDEGLNVLVAFSRDKDKPRQYVQDQIRAHAREIREAIQGRNGKVYVCGSSGNMPKGVREALVDVFVDGGDEGVMGREEAEAFLVRMEKEGRYKQETW